jgi:hypothetical protein
MSATTDWITAVSAGAAAMAAFASAITWVGGRIVRWRVDRSNRKVSGWAGINPHSITDWRVSLAPEDDPNSTRVLLDVASVSEAASLRWHASSDHKLSRVPTADEIEVIRFRWEQRGS